MLFLSFSLNAYGIRVVNNTDFSIEVPNGWVYREDFLFDNNIILTPNEFSDVLITDNVSTLLDGLDDGVIVESAPDVSFPIKKMLRSSYMLNTV